MSVQLETNHPYKFKIFSQKTKQVEPGLNVHPTSEPGKSVQPKPGTPLGVKSSKQKVSRRAGTRSHARNEGFIHLSVDLKDRRKVKVQAGENRFDQYIKHLRHTSYAGVSALFHL